MEVPAYPEKLQAFVDAGRPLTSQAISDVNALREMWDNVVRAPNDYAVGDPAGLLSDMQGGDVARMLGMWDNEDNFVQLVARAFKQLDSTSRPDRVSIGSWRVDSWLAYGAKQAGVDVAVLNGKQPAPPPKGLVAAPPPPPPGPPPLPVPPVVNGADLIPGFPSHPMNRPPALDPLTVEDLLEIPLTPPPGSVPPGCRPCRCR